MNENRPGSEGEHALQERYGTFKRAAAFYDKQMLDRLNPLMQEYMARQEMMFVSTADANGECDASFRAGPPGFVRVIDDRTVIYPEYRGNGVMASMGNIAENAHVGLLFVDFFHSGVGMHINGRARIVDHGSVQAFAPVLERLGGTLGELEDTLGDKKKTPERWIMVDIVEAYIHCSKHIPILAHLPGNAGQAPPSGDHFKAKDDGRPWVQAPACPVPGFYPDAHADADADTDTDDDYHADGAEAPGAEQAPHELIASEQSAPRTPGPAGPADPEPEPAPAPARAVPEVVGIEAFLDADEAEMVTRAAVTRGSTRNDELDELLPPAWAPVGRP
jgi:predicted pyridoxine 5'-phosphate oxidase superfamily flavin-nucleotide-binding protein